MATLNPDKTGYTAAYTATGTGIQWGQDMYLGNHLGVARFKSAISSSYTSFSNCWIKSATVKIKTDGTLASSTITIAVTNTAPPSPSANPPKTPSCYRSGDFTCNKTGTTTIDITSLFKRGGNNTYLKPNDTTWYIVFKMNSSTSGRLEGKDDYSSAAEFTYTIAAKPSVSIGDPITVTQMTNLSDYLGSSGSGISQGASITHSGTNDLATNTQYSTIEASWYNNA